jgi:menaquinone-dependent protoporphyrinogen oxidase
MRILVTAASKYGSTAEIAAAIATRLRERGLDADVRRPAAVLDLARYDAVVLGSAVYAGRWLEPARAFAHRLSSELSERPVWLFSSGPIGSPEPRPPGEPFDVAELMDVSGAEEHRVFAGRLASAHLSFSERAIVRALGATFGDFRDWTAIAAFADVIAEQLTRPLTSVETRSDRRLVADDDRLRRTDP